MIEALETKHFVNAAGEYLGGFGGIRRTTETPNPREIVVTDPETGEETRHVEQDPPTITVTEEWPDLPAGAVEVTLPPVSQLERWNGSAWVVSVEKLQKDITDAIQERLDAFARTRGYDHILSAATYATSAVPQFQAEGQYCINARDATWAKAGQMLAEIQGGTRPIPGSYADFEPELPVLAWPT
jgi:hypothetical protein